MMIGKFLSQFLGNIGEKNITGDNRIERANGEDLLEYDDGEWIIINILESHTLPPAEADRLENLLIEHPSMSVYQLMSTDTKREGELTSDEDEDEDLPKPVPLKRHLLWRLAGWGSPTPCSTSVFATQSAKIQMDRRKNTRSALQRQNLAKVRFSTSDRRYGFFKQPCNRLYNY